MQDQEQKVHVAAAPEKARAEQGAGPTPEQRIAALEARVAALEETITRNARAIQAAWDMVPFGGRRG